MSFLSPYYLLFLRRRTTEKFPSCHLNIDEVKQFQNLSYLVSKLVNDLVVVIEMFEVPLTKGYGKI